MRRFGDLEAVIMDRLWEQGRPMLVREMVEELRGDRPLAYTTVMDGRHFADGLVVMTYVEGGSPETEADWRRVADTLRQLHRFTHGWPQRPGWRSSTDLPARRDRDEGRPRRDAA